MRYDPIVGELINKNLKLKLEWGVFTVREAPKYFRFVGDHKSKDGSLVEKKCITCVRFKKPEIKHSANGQCCVSPD